MDIPEDVFQIVESVLANYDGDDAVSYSTMMASAIIADRAISGAAIGAVRKVDDVMPYDELATELAEELDEAKRTIDALVAALEGMREYGVAPTAVEQQADAALAKARQ